jgi:hypothetical protein
VGLAITRVSDGIKNISHRRVDVDIREDRVNTWRAIATEAFGADAILAEETTAQESAKRIVMATALGKGDLWVTTAQPDVDDNQKPRMTREALVAVDTTGFSDQDPVYLDADNAGELVLTANGGPRVGTVVGTDLVKLHPQDFDRTVLYMPLSVANAALKTLNATPIDVIAAPAAGTAVELVYANAMLDYSTDAFDAVGATDYLRLQYDSGDVLTQDVNPVGFGDATADAWMKLMPASYVYSAATKVVVTISGGEWFGTDTSTSTLELLVAYRVVTLADLA